MLKESRIVAMIGASPRPDRPSYGVMRVLQDRGHKVYPVNPASAGEIIHGETVLAHLDEVPEPIDMVDIFRRSEEAGRLVDEAIETLLERGLRTIWMQFGVIDHAAAKRAEAKGLTVIMDRCPKIEYQRLWGELRWGGFNTGVISSKLRPLGG